MTHFTRAELERWHQSPDAHDRQRIVEHLAVCDECGRLYGEVIDAQAAEVTPRHADHAAAVESHGRQVFHRRNRSPVRWIVAAAAAIVIGAVIFPDVTRKIQREGDEPIAVRGGTLQALSPVGPVSPPIHFQWASPFAVPRYRLEVFDAGGRTVATFVTAEERAAVADVVSSPLAPGMTYEWQVTALDEASAPIATSGRARFTIAR